MSASRRRTANDLLCGAITSPLLEYAVVILVHGVSYQSVDQLPEQDCKISVQIARVNEELPLLTTKTTNISQPIFEEVLVVHTETLEELELLLCTANDVIDEYDLRVGECELFQCHHITLAGQCSELFITMIVKTKHLPASPPPSLDVQVLVQFLEAPLKDPRGVVVVTGRDHFTNAFSQIQFNSNDQVQLSTPQGPSDQPQWYHTFLFRNCNVNQTLGISLFHQPYMLKNDRWMLGSKIGDCGILLDEQLIGALHANKDGICFSKIPLSSTQTTIRASIRLGSSTPLTPNNIPESVTTWGDLPVLAKQQQGGAGVQVVKSRSRQASEGESGSVTSSTALPDHSAILQLLQRHSTPLDNLPATQPALLEQPTTNNSVEYMSKIIEQQATELKNYREAVRKMGEDVLLCRDHIISLKSDNVKLKSIVKSLQAPVHEASLSNIPKDDLVREVLKLRRALREEIEQHKEANKSVTKLRQAARTYESERSKMDELRNAHAAQNQLLQKLQEKVKVTRVLERTCRDQEKVIERLEGMLNISEPAPLKQVKFKEDLLALPAPAYAIPKLEPVQQIDSETMENIPTETALKLRVKALENQLKVAKTSHEEEIVKLASDKMDLQIQLAKHKR